MWLFWQKRKRKTRQKRDLGFLTIAFNFHIMLEEWQMSYRVQPVDEY
jgi:hypothetical protein